MTETSIYLVDDNEDFRRSTEWWLRGEGYEVCSFDDGDAAMQALLALAPGQHPMCLLLDVRMPGLSGPELHSRLVQAGLCGPQGPLPVIYMTGHGEVPLAVEAMQKGAVTFLEKPVSNRALHAALEQVRELRRRLAPVPQVAPARPADQTGQTEFDQLAATLTERERQVMAGLLDNLTNKGVARRLGLSHKTVELYRARLMQKMEVRNFADLKLLSALGTRQAA